MKPVKTWILIADGSRARVFLNEGPGRGISEREDCAREANIRPSRDIDADRPGRAFDSAGQGRHAMEPPTDAKRHDKQTFHKGLADMLEAAFNSREFDRLVLVAPPATLGDLREFLPKNVAGVVHGELAKDLTKLPEQELVDHLGDVLAV